MSDKIPSKSKRSCNINIDYKELHNTGRRVEKLLGSSPDSTISESSSGGNSFSSFVNTEEDLEVSKLFEQLSISDDKMSVDNNDKVQFEVLEEDISDYIAEHSFQGYTLPVEDIASRICKLASFRTQYRNLD